MLERKVNRVSCRGYVGALPVDRTRRRGSALILVMTLLGVLFVTGIVFLKTMSFEARMINAEREQYRDEAGMDGAADEVASTLQESVIGAAGLPFGSSPLGVSLTAYAELPGVHNLSAPIEPYWTSGTPPQLVFGSFTDAHALVNGPHDGSWFRHLRSLGMPGIDTGWPSGVAKRYDDSEAGISILIYPVDSDGDGVVDTLQFPLTAVDADHDGVPDAGEVPPFADVSTLGMGFSRLQIEGLGKQLNAASNPGGQVHLALRIIPHGGMVNLNESHPELIKAALGLRENYLLTNTPDPVNWGFYLNHRPTREQRFYSPFLEEPTLRRRGLLPPRVMIPSLLHGNPLLDPKKSEFGDSDMPQMLFPPVLNDPYGVGFETVYEGRHRSTPFTMAKNTDGTWTERYRANDADSDALWAVRMEPFTEFDDATQQPGVGYDRRHVSTTISHDALLSRGARWTTVDGTGKTVTTDVLEKMRAANLAADMPGEDCANIYVPFEYPAYPHSIVDNCDCPTRPSCRFDKRKGRLLLSLPWLDKLTDRRIRERLIHDAFMMLLTNAKGSYWEDKACALDGDCAADEYCDAMRTKPVCVDQLLQQPRRAARTSRTAASLTANLLDFMDSDGWCQGGTKNGQACHTDSECPGGTCVGKCSGGANNNQACRTDADCAGGVCADDDIPTPVALRSFDFDENRCAGGTSEGQLCSGPATCPGGKCAPTAGWEFGDQRRFPAGFPVQYVYGLERQAYITEVSTTAVDHDGDPMTTPLTVAWAVELFNPYNVPLNRSNDYWIYTVDQSGNLNAIQLASFALSPSAFTAFFSSDEPGRFEGVGEGTTPTSDGRIYELPVPLTFGTGWTIYLVRRLEYSDPSGTMVVPVVVDQFTVDGPNTGGTTVESGTKTTYSMQRMVASNTMWKAPVPKAVEDVGHTLGSWNTAADDNVRPVEVNFANTGSFGQPRDPDNLPATGVAFPTTGTLLLLMRHANRSFDDRSVSVQIEGVTHDVTHDDLAFTAWLKAESAQIDNGRMPVFDLLKEGNRYAHHTDPAAGACYRRAAVNSPWICDPNLETLDLCPESANQQFAMGATCSSDPAHAHRDLPGDLPNLPWGQLVFDYFTALPLSSAGPYANPTGDPEFVPARADSIPRVDLDGLRVHGRININAAPWTVLSGLPLVPGNRFPVEFRSRLEQFASNTNRCLGGPRADQPCDGNDACPDGTCPAVSIGQSLAQAVVAYREARSIGGSGDYDTGTPARIKTEGTSTYPRGWRDRPPDLPPVARRGTGYMTAGELANVRHSGAGWTLCEELSPPQAPPCRVQPVPGYKRYSFFRTDAGMISDAQSERKDQDYVAAVALLVSLGDWVTVRSDVFTVYGTLRGDGNPNILDRLEQAKDVDTRALRFQETIDRLPVFLGEPAPVRIGERVFTRYVDVRND